MFRILLILSFSFCSVSSYAQTEREDTLSHKYPHSEQELNSVNTQTEFLSDIRPLIPQELTDKYISGFGLNSYNNTKLSVPKYSPYITTWSQGGIALTNGRQNMPGMMGVESSSLGITQSVGAFSFVASSEVNKYATFNNLLSSVGVGGNTTYNANDKLSITLFGYYYSPVRPTSPGITPGIYGYMKTSNIGGYIDYRINDKWGVKTGVQSYRSMLTNKWETQPIVMPYFRISKKNDIGIDVGGILYQFIKWNAGKNWHQNNNPTIPPPRD